MPVQVPTWLPELNLVTATYLLGSAVDRCSPTVVGIRLRLHPASQCLGFAGRLLRVPCVRSSPVHVTQIESSRDIELGYLPALDLQLISGIASVFCLTHVDAALRLSQALADMLQRPTNRQAQACSQRIGLGQCYLSESDFRAANEWSPEHLTLPDSLHDIKRRQPVASPESPGTAVAGNEEWGTVFFGRLWVSLSVVGTLSNRKAKSHGLGAEGNDSVALQPTPSDFYDPLGTNHESSWLHGLPHQLPPTYHGTPSDIESNGCLTVRPDRETTLTVDSIHLRHPASGGTDVAPSKGTTIKAPFCTVCKRTATVAGVIACIRLTSGTSVPTTRAPTFVSIALSYHTATLWVVPSFPRVRPSAPILVREHPPTTHHTLDIHNPLE